MGGLGLGVQEYLQPATLNRNPVNSLSDTVHLRSSPRAVRKLFRILTERCLRFRFYCLTFRVQGLGFGV